MVGNHATTDATRRARQVAQVRRYRMAKANMPTTIRYWILNASRVPVAVTDPVEWADWFECHKDERCVANEADAVHGWRVHTHFRCFVDDGDNAEPPLIWETVVYGGPLHGHVERYTERDAAYVGHGRMVALIRAHVLRDGTRR